MKAHYTSLFVPLSLSSGSLFAQCGAGEVEVTIGITTDDFGYETYWQLVPGGNACGDGTIFEGGNLTIGCGGGGLQNQEPSGYEPTTTYMEGPWCLPQGSLYTIYMIDDWGDGQAGVEVFVNGVSAVQFGMGQGPINALTFTAQGPVARDMGVTELTTALFAHVNETVHVRGTVTSYGSEPVTSFDLSYSVDGGAPVTAAVSGITINAGDAYEFVHDVPWLPSSEGAVQLTVSVSNINGDVDLNTFNDQLGSSHVISAEIPDLANDYLAADPLVTVVANSDQDLLVPRDLAFHPESARNQLWVINKDTEESGGSTVTFYEAGETGMTHEWRKDVNSWHFMSLPSAIAMGDNNCFATCPGIYDANHNGGDSFTGPSLWSADTSIYCRFYGGLGSHLDMLHVDPNSQEIAHEFWNRYWVVDGFRGDIVMNDFRKDHGPGNDYHGDAIIERYADFSITKDPGDHVVSHDVFDKSTGWLYVVDFGGQRVLRLNTNTGTVSGPGIYGPFESYVQYSMVTGYEWEAIITEGLDQPAGIELVGTHLYVSDHANGDIIIYDISGSTFPELGRIHTNTPGLMGITVGPNGRIWGVNATTHELLRIDPQEPTGVEEAGIVPLRCWPNPADEKLTFERPTGLEGEAEFLLRDAAGRLVRRGVVTSSMTAMTTGILSAGTYALEVRAGGITSHIEGHHRPLIAGSRNMFRAFTRYGLAFGFATVLQPGLVCAQNWEVFDMAGSGFPSDNISDIVQDSQGIIRAATSWGLCRYDGTDWTVYQSGTSGLPGNVIRSLAIDSLDRVWIGTQLHGIAVFDGVSWEVIDVDNSPLPDNEINSVTIDHRGWAWIGTYLGILCYTGDEWRIYNTSDTAYAGLQLNGNTILHASVRPDGLTAIATLNGGFHYLTDTAVVVHASYIDFFPDNTQNEVAFDLENNERWIATPSQGLLRQGGSWYDGPWFQYTTNNSLIPSNAVNCVRVDDQSRVWFGTLLAGLGMREPDGGFTNYTSSNSGLPDNTVQCVMVANDGSIWVGTGYGGLAHLTFTEAITEGMETGWKLYPNPCQGDLWVETGQNSGMDRWWIIDQAGRAVKSGRLGSDRLERIALGDLAPSTYTFLLDGKHTRKAGSSPSSPMTSPHLDPGVGGVYFWQPRDPVRVKLNFTIHMRSILAGAALSVALITGTAPSASGQCDDITTNGPNNMATSCGCASPGQTNCDLLPDIMISWQAMQNEQYYSGLGGPTEYSQTSTSTTGSPNTANAGRLRCSGGTPNVGMGPLEVRGVRADGYRKFICGPAIDSVYSPNQNNVGYTCSNGYTAKQILFQRIYHKNGNTMSFTEYERGTMTYHPTHQHYHVNGWTTMTLRIQQPGVSDPRLWPIIATGGKLGFCLTNLFWCSSANGYCRTTPNYSPAGSVITNTAFGGNYALGSEPGCSDDVQSIVAGKGDVYSENLDGMWINLMPGLCNNSSGAYYIVAEVDPSNDFIEANDANNWMALPINLTAQTTGPVTGQGNIFCSGNTVLGPGQTRTLTASPGTAYAWSTGATSRSITVSAAGTYSCTVTCPCGTLSTPSISITALSAPVAPTGTDATLLGPGSATLGATGGDVHWFDAQSAGSEVGAGNSFNTPVIQGTTSYWAEDRNTFAAQEITVGRANNTTQGGYLSDKQWMFFDATAPFKLKSFKVRANSTGQRHFVLVDRLGTLIAEKYIEIPTGLNTIEVNWDVPVGSQHRITAFDDNTEVTRNLWYNNAGVTYPYPIGTFGSITGSSNGAGNYYYLYDWVVGNASTVATSARTQVTAFVVNPVSLALNVKLEGPLDEATGIMQDPLRTAGFIPATEPYTTLGFAQAAGGGGESFAPSVLTVTGNDAIVDWVRVELRAQPSPNVVVATRQALLQRDGDVVATDGVSPIQMGVGAGNYYVAVRHRNHMGAMTSTAIALAPATTSIDLSSAATATWGTDARKAVGAVMALWTGNGYQDAQLKYTGSGNDRDPILQTVGSTTPTNTVAGYQSVDVNMDGVVKYTGSGNDRDPILVNVGSTTPNNVRSEQLP